MLFRGLFVAALYGRLLLVLAQGTALYTSHSKLHVTAVITLWPRADFVLACHQCCLL